MARCPVRAGFIKGALLGSAALIAVPAHAQIQTTNEGAPPSTVPAEATGTVPAPAQDAGAPSGVADIVVTAQKREQNLQVVPISITAIGQNQLVANRVADVRDLSALAPNLTVRVAAGGSASPSYNMRGLVTAGTAPGSDKGVSLYLDGVYLQSVQGSIFSVADVERIEVLRGPQGTLFGRNSTGGAVSFVTREPSGEFRVRQEASYGNFDYYRSKTRVELPKIGPFSISASYLHSQRDGDTRNLGAGTVFNYGPASGGRLGLRTSPKRLGDDNTDAVFVAVKADLLDGLSLSYKFDYANVHYTPEAQGVALIFPQALGASAGLISGTIAAQPRFGVDPNSLTPVSTTRPDAVNNAFTTPGFTRTTGHNVTARYEITDQIAIKNVFGYRTVRNVVTYQLDGFGGLRNAVGTLGPVGAPFGFVVSTGGTFEHQWSNETQINIDTDWFTLTAGYLHFQDRNRTGGFDGVPNFLQFGTFPTPAGAPGILIPTSANRQTVVRTSSDAWFVQPEMHLTDRLDLVLGARITKDRKKGVDNGARSTLGTLVIDYRNSKPTYLAGLNYRATDDILTYAKVSTGYISGGQLAGLSFAPETSLSYEAGIKADLFDRRLRTNLALFDVKYSNLQFSQLGNNLRPPIQAPQVLVNAGDAKAKGFEFEATAVPVTGLTLNGAVGYTDFKFTTVSPFLATFGNYIPTYRPKWTGTGAIQYETPEFAAGGHLLFRVDANYRSSLDGAASFPTLAFRDAARVDHSWIVNGRVALVDVEIGGLKAQIAGWGRNLFDNKKISTATSLNFLIAANYERERTYGLDLTLDF